jgi:nitronate monooxygenase
MASALDNVRLPIVLAPLAGGPSTPELAIAVAGAGGLAFLAAGYRTADQLRADIQAVRATTSAPFGVNLFVPTPDAAEAAVVARYADRIAGEAERMGVGLGDAAWTDDQWDAKLAVLREERPAIASFTFGSPDAGVVATLRASGIEVWVTVTEPDEGAAAWAAGADGLVAQGVEAGGHRGTFVDADSAGEIGLLALLRLLSREARGPLVAAGGIADGAGIAAALVAGARAAQVGTAFLDTHEAGTSSAHRTRLRSGAPTRLTRAFSGRRARGLVNRFLVEHSAAAPSAYPQVNQMTSPLRAAGRQRGDADVLNLWAGQAHRLIDHDVPAAAVVSRLERELREALTQARAWEARVEGPG